MRVEMVSGVFLAIAILLTINGSSGMPALVPRGMENEIVWEAILYGYKIDPEAPAYLARGDRIFEETTDETFLKDLIAISPNPTMEIAFEYSDSEHTASKNLASSMSVSGSYGAFSAAASMEVSSSSNTNIKTVRMDAVTKALRYHVASKGGLRIYPENYLTDNFRRAVQSLTVEQIEDRIGIFYATEMDLGGEVRKSYTMQATSQDTEQSVNSELTASYGTAMMGVSATASIGVSSRTSNANAQMKIEWSAKGGNTMVWLGKDFTDSGDTSVSSIQSDWMNTIDDDNLYPFNFELGLMWELVKHVDEDKGNKFQQYLENKWEANINSFKPTTFIEGNKVTYEITHTTGSSKSDDGATSGAYFFTVFGPAGETDEHDCRATRSRGFTSYCTFEDKAEIGKLAGVRIKNKSNDRWAFYGVKVKIDGVLRGRSREFTDLDDKKTKTVYLTYIGDREVTYQITHTTGSSKSDDGATSGAYFFTVFGSTGETDAHDCRATRSRGSTASCTFKDKGEIGTLRGVRIVNTSDNRWAFYGMSVKINGVLRGYQSGSRKTNLDRIETIYFNNIGR